MAQDLISAFEQKSNDVLEGLKKEADSLVALRNSESGCQPDIDRVYVESLQAKYAYYEDMAMTQSIKVDILKKQLEEKALTGGGDKDLQTKNGSLRSENIQAMAKLSTLQEKFDKFS